MMHIVLVGDYPREPQRIEGGVEAVVLYLSQALQQTAGLRVSVVTLERWGRGHQQTEHGGVAVHYLPVSKLPSRLSLHANIRQMRDEIVRLQPDLVHAQGTGEYAFAAAQSGAPWVLTLHGMRHQEVALRKGLLNRYRAWLIARDERAIVMRAPHVISINPHVGHVFGAYIKSKLYTIENPVAEGFFQIGGGKRSYQPHHLSNGQNGQSHNGTNGESDNGVRPMLYVGRLNPRKDILTLLHAFAQVHAQRPDAKLWLAGDGTSGGEPTPYYLELRRFVAENRLDGAVRFLGNLTDPALLQAYAQCALVALSSKVETAPMAISQAMAAGKPVVSTDAGGARYMVENGATGFVVPVADSDALAHALLRVWEDEATAIQMGRLAHERAENRFRAARVAAQTREVYGFATTRG
jgi:glycosyltransferase involved in cell wall biosynthesis